MVGQAPLALYRAVHRAPSCDIRCASRLHPPTGLDTLTQNTASLAIIVLCIKAYHIDDNNDLVGAGALLADIGYIAGGTIN